MFIEWKCIRVPNHNTYKNIKRKMRVFNGISEVKIVNLARTDKPTKFSVQIPFLLYILQKLYESLWNFIQFRTNRIWFFFGFRLPNADQSKHLPIVQICVIPDHHYAVISSILFDCTLCAKLDCVEIRRKGDSWFE